jgi:hypothetical protein
METGQADGVAACGPHMAYSTLDGMRAVLATGNITGMGPDPITTMYGYSGGASIVSWVRPAPLPRETRKRG